MNLDAAMQTYIAESRELLQDAERDLLALENDPANTELISAIFRAVHTIKGSAGIFGLDAIVSFTHVAESLLDRVRDGHIGVTPELIAVFLSSTDHIHTLVTVVAERGESVSEETRGHEATLLESLRAFLGEKPAAEPAPSATRAVTATDEPVEASGGGLVGNDNWHLSLRFGPEVLRNGMDPLSFIRYLGKLGKIVSITTLLDSLPEMAKLDPEACYLGFEIDFQSDETKETIEGVFEFVREDSAICILPPKSKLAEYAELIRKQPPTNERLGEILVASGALTAHELEAALQTQSRAAQDIEQASLFEGEATPARPLGEILVERNVVQRELVDTALDKQKEIKETRSTENRYVRVQADKLDELINLVGELVIAGAGATMLSQRNGDGALIEANSLVLRLVEQIRDGALRLRMVQIGETFNRFQRVVRDVSKELGKDIALEISGAETELDKTVVEKIGDPLTHLVRNSIDHGIEPADVRAARGKPERGTVRLNAYHDSGSIVIEISDDGGGLKKDKILQKAWERGLVSPNANLTDQEIYNLIFEPGFSTADQVSNLSGRGVGMDVVKRNITALRGTVELESEEGVGTLTRIRLPLTLAIIDGFLVGVGDSTYVVPLDMVLECVELTDGARNESRQHNYINLRGEVLPFVRLREHFEIDGLAGRRENIVVVQFGSQKAGLVVDKLMGEFQTVIKPLGKMFSRVKGLSGSTILGTGEVALILDVPSLVQQATEREVTASHAVMPEAASIQS